MKNWYKYLIVLLLGLFIGFMINIPSCNTEIREVRDTIVIDSIHIQEKTKYKYTTNYDTLIQLDTIIQLSRDTVFIPISIPIQHKQYNDTILSNNVESFVTIDYHGFNSNIDKLTLVNNVKQEEYKKKAEPFVGLKVGPVMTYDFKGVAGVSTGVNAGLFFKNGFGIQAEYELDVLKSDITNSVKIGIIKKF